MELMLSKTPLTLSSSGLHMAPEVGLAIISNWIERTIKPICNTGQLNTAAALPHQYIAILYSLN